MENAFKIGDIVDTPLGIQVEIYELSTVNGEVRATGKFRGESRGFLTYPVHMLRKSEKIKPAPVYEPTRMTKEMRMIQYAGG